MEKKTNERRREREMREKRNENENEEQNDVDDDEHILSYSYISSTTSGTLRTPNSTVENLCEQRKYVQFSEYILNSNKTRLWSTLKALRRLFSFCR